MKIKILRGTKINAESVKAGEIVDVAEKEAKYLIAKGKANPYTAPKTSKKAKHDT